MPNVERTPRQTLRIDRDLWEEFGAATGHRARGEVVRAFIEWYVSRPNARRPVRPKPEEWPASHHPDA